MKPEPRPAGRRLGPTLAALAATALATSLACAGGATPGPVPLSPTAAPTDGVEATPTAQTPRTFDLAAQSPLLTISAVAAGDFAQGVQTLSHGDFNGDGFQDLLAGAPFADGPDNSRQDAGEAYVIVGGSDLPSAINLAEGEQDLTLYGATAGDSLGFSVLGADLNGDGIDDVIVGAPGVTGDEDPRTDQGQVYVLFGSPDLGGSLDIASDPPSLTVTGSEGFSRVGHVTASGDVNGDGVDDLILGAPFAGREPNTPPGGPRTEVGEVYVVLGGASLGGSVSIVTGQQEMTFVGEKQFGQFGGGVAAGDVNGDGIDDVVIGAPQADEPDESRPAAGAVYVFLGGEEVGGRISVGDKDVIVMGAAAGDSLGFPLAVADVNGDGVDDIVSGARRASGSDETSTSGAVSIMLGGSDVPATIDLAEPGRALNIFGSSRAELLPTSLALSDLDGDGAADLVLGSAQAGTALGAAESGRVYVVRGGRTRPEAGPVDEAADFTVAGAAAGGFLGSAVDGFYLTGEPEIVALAAGALDPDSASPGRIYVIPLSPP